MLKNVPKNHNAFLSIFLFVPESSLGAGSMPQVISAHNNKRLSISKVSLCLFQPIIGLLTFYQSFKIVQSTVTYPSLEISLLRQVIGHPTAFLRGKSFLGSNSYWKKKRIPREVCELGLYGLHPIGQVVGIGKTAQIQMVLFDLCSQYTHTPTQQTPRTSHQ